MLSRLKHVSATKRAKEGFRLWPTLLFFIAFIVLLALFCVFFTIPQKIHGVGLILLQGDLKQITSPVSGMVDTWLKQEGDGIELGDRIAIIRDHEQHEKPVIVDAKVRGILGEIIAYPDTTVTKGQSLAIVTNFGDPRKDLELIGFVSSLEGKKIKPGMKALIDPSITDPYMHGHLVAEVKRVGKLPMTKAAVQSVVKIPEVANYIRSQIEAEPFVVMLSFIHNDSTVTGYQWTGPGPSFELDSGVIANISIIYDEPTILNLLWPSIFHRRVGAQ